MQENIFDIVSSVPDHIGLSILDFLDVKDLIECEKCCQSWKALARDNSIWKRKCRQYNFRELKTNEQSENYVRFCRKFSPHWKGIFVYHHNLRKNWLEKSDTVYLTDPKDEQKLFYYHHIDDKILVLQESDFSIRILNSSTQKILKILRGHAHWVYEAKICGNVLVSSSTDCTLKVWNIEQEMCVHSKWFNSDLPKFALSNGRVASANNNSSIIEVWRADTGEVLLPIHNQHPISCFVIHDDSIVTGCIEGIVRIFSLDDGILKNFMRINRGYITQIMVKSLQSVSVLQNGFVKILNTADGSLLHPDQQRCNIPPISLDDDRIAWVSSRSVIKIWDVHRRQTVRTIKHNKLIVAITANEDFLFCVDENNMVGMWDLNTGEFKRLFVALPII